MTLHNLFTGAAPQLSAADDAAPVNLGTEFYATGPAWVTGLKFLAAATPGSYQLSTLDRTAGLYTVHPDGQGGDLVAGPVTIPITAGQWCTADLPAPYPLTVGTRYRVVVHHPDGRYPATAHRFDAGNPASVDGPLTAPNVDGAYFNAQGSYTYAAALAFPVSSFNATAYYADVTATDTDPTPPPPVGNVVTVAGTLLPALYAGALPAGPVYAGTLAGPLWEGELL